jgi:hypothetical protein
MNSLPPPHGHPQFLTRSAERSLAASAITTTTEVEPVLAHVAADTIDLVSQAVLTAVGLAEPAASRAVLAILWSTQ